MRIAWDPTRGTETLRFNRPHTFFVIGVRGSGKSACLEHIAENFLAEGHTVLDLFGSRDGEGLAWLRSEHAKNKRILVIHGDNVTVSSSFDTKNVSKLSLSDLTNYDILISSSPLYSSIDDEFTQVNRIIDVLYKRLSWKNLVFMITREAANLYYSRLRISPNQLAAKELTTYLIREGRHCGIALGLDTLKYTSIDADIRAVVDYFIFKSQGIKGFPKDLAWLYGFWNPAIVRHMPPRYFFIASSQGPLGIGKFPCPPWHKQERENILNSVGLKVEYGERIEYGQSRGAYKTVGDEEHINIIDSYFEGSSMGKISKKLDRSAATVHAQIHAHDESIEKNGYCVECRRLKGEHETVKTSDREER
jgi:hypothetical protein